MHTLMTGDGVTRIGRVSSSANDGFALGLGH
jgi:hypothetical protein